MKRLRATVLGALFVVLFGVCAAPGAALVQADAEDDAAERMFPESATARRSYREYARTLDAAQTRYHQAYGRSVEAFVSRSESAISRYQQLLGRIQREHTRAGELDAAREVQAMADFASEWEPSAPDADGTCFIDRVGLDVAGSEPASGAGVDLLVSVTEYKLACLEAIERDREAYRTSVRDARARLIRLLEQSREQAMRAGDLEAVDEIAQAVESLTLQGDEVVLPEVAPQGDGGGLAGGQVDAAVEAQLTDDLPYGFYLFNGRRTNSGRRGQRFSMLTHIDENGATRYLIRWNNGWRLVELAGRSEVQPEGKVVLRLNNGNEDAMAMEWTPQGEGRASARIWWVGADYAAGAVDNATGTMQHIGGARQQIESLPNGSYVADLTSRISPDGGSDRQRFQHRYEVQYGQVTRWQVRSGDDWGAVNPRPMLVEQQDDLIVLRYDPSVEDNPAVMTITFDERGRGEARLWWNTAWYERGDEPSATGPIQRR